MKLLASGRNRWLLLAALWIMLLVIGIGGFLQQSRDGGFHRSFLDNFYFTLQLAALDYGAGDEALNWRLQLARFVAPVMAASTVLQTASLVFVEQYRQFRLRFVSGHTIVCGLGETGARIAQAFADSGATVVAVESDPGSAGVAAARASDITVVIGDATDGGVLQTARVGRAARLVCVSGDDAVNLQISIAAADLTSSSSTALRCSVHLRDAELAEFLRAADLDATQQIRVSFFNVHERAARTLVAENPPFIGDGAAQHLLVLGLGLGLRRLRGTPHRRSTSENATPRCSHSRRMKGNTRLTNSSRSSCMSRNVDETKTLIARASDMAWRLGVNRHRARRSTNGRCSDRSRRHFVRDTTAGRASSSSDAHPGTLPRRSAGPRS